jgi:hypothetical protein
VPAAVPTVPSGRSKVRLIRSAMPGGSAWFGLRRDREADAVRDGGDAAPVVAAAA